jgi:hypothetical protein
MNSEITNSTKPTSIKQTNKIPSLYDFTNKLLFELFISDFFTEDNTPEVLNYLCISNPKIFINEKYIINYIKVFSAKIITKDNNIINLNHDALIDLTGYDTTDIAEIRLTYYNEKTLFTTKPINKPFLIHVDLQEKEYNDKKYYSKIIDQDISEELINKVNNFQKLQKETKTKELNKYLKYSSVDGF